MIIVTIIVAYIVDNFKNNSVDNFVKILRDNKKKKTWQGKRSAMPSENGARARHVAADIKAADLRAIGAVRTAMFGAGPRLF